MRYTPSVGQCVLTSTFLLFHKVYLKESVMAQNPWHEITSPVQNRLQKSVTLLQTLLLSCVLVFLFICIPLGSDVIFLYFFLNNNNNNNNISLLFIGAFLRTQSPHTFVCLRFCLPYLINLNNSNIHIEYVSMCRCTLPLTQRQLGKATKDQFSNPNLMQTQFSLMAVVVLKGLSAFF